MRDIYCEQLVQKQRTAKTKLIKVLLVSACLLLMAAATMVLIRRSVILTLLALLILTAVTRTLTMAMNLEYEYTVTNGELDVDQITAKRKRKRLLTVDCANVEDFGRYRREDHQARDYGAKVFACDSRSSPTLWYCVVRGDHGRTLLVFNASDKLLEGIRPFLPRTVAADAFRENG